MIIGQSECGKSTLLKYLLGLRYAGRQKNFYGGQDINSAIKAPSFYGKKIRVLYQSGALWSSMTLTENVALLLETYINLNRKEIDEIVSLKLSFVGLKGSEHFYPSQISGDMQKRAALARAIALAPEILFFDESSDGLDSISAKRLDDLILELKNVLELSL